MLSYNTPVAVALPSTRESNSAPSVSVPSTNPHMSAIKPSNASSSSVRIHNLPPHKFHHIWLVTGPAGCGKSTVAAYLSEALNFPYIEGDEYHPAANVEKMSNGIPLTDADRWDWLTALREESMRRIDDGSDGVVLTCSALKRKYRDVIRVAGYFNPSLHIHFIYLDAPESVLVQRVAGRKNHFMPPSMVRSQFDVLERPTQSETDVVTVDVSRPMDVVMHDALEAVLTGMD
ncbi:putative gluconokinase [Ceratocystis lukuohia]|uniref:Gluconokinase n=2 Tax=Ceratocystis TaxID=5157 RepID=A0A0F8BJP1_CERFI|nr:putative gluconokinase [Ceratocystis platani]